MTMNGGPAQVTTQSGGTSPAHSTLGISQGLVWPSLGLTNVQIQVLKKYFNVSKSQFQCWLCRVTCRQLALLWEHGAALGTQGCGAGGVQEGEPSRSPMLFSGPSASIARPRHNCPVGAQGAGRGSQELGDGVASKQAWLGSSQGCSLGSGLARLLSLPGGCPS